MKNLIWLLLAIVGIQYATAKEDKKSDTFLGKFLGLFNKGKKSDSNPAFSENPNVQVLDDSVVGVETDRQVVMQTVASQTYKLLKGLTTVGEVKQFVQVILKVNSDNEFRYLKSIFPAFANGNELERFVTRQALVTRKVIEQINDEFERRGMHSRFIK